MGKNCQFIPVFSSVCESKLCKFLSVSLSFCSELQEVFHGFRVNLGKEHDTVAKKLIR